MARKAFDDIKEGVKIGEKFVKEIRFADDKCIIASKEKSLQKLISSLGKIIKLRYENKRKED